MSTIKRLFGLLVTVGIIALGLGMILPTSFSVSRSVTVHVRPEVVHRVVENLTTWPQWTGWDKTDDPTFAFDMSHAGTGAGAAIAWHEAKGPGKLTLTRSDRDDGVTFDLALGRDTVNAHGSVSYAYDADAQATTVTWSETGVFEGRPVAAYLAIRERLTLGKRLDVTLKGLAQAAQEELHRN